VIRAGSALRSDPDLGRAAALAAESVLADCGDASADAAFVFCTGAGDLASVGVAARRVLGTRNVVAVEGHAVAAGDREEEGGPACAVLALRGVDAALFAVSGEVGAAEAIGAEVEALLGRSTCESDLVVVFADPLAADPRALAEALATLGPATVVGAGAGLEGAGSTRLLAGNRSAAGGACGLVIALPEPPRVAVSQGCRPVTEPLVVTRASGHWVLELAGKPALDVYRDVVRAPLAEDLRRAAESMLLALPRSSRPRARGTPSQSWVARRIAGFAPERGAFAAPEPVAVGSALRFALRDADFAREELSRALATTGAAAFGLHLLASDRGRALLGHAGLEAAMVAHAFAPAPVAALSGSFEIAPLADRTEALAHASVLVSCSNQK
jgi:small ligand-binding sensory domain FIST